MSVQEMEKEKYIQILEAVPTNVPAFEALRQIYSGSEDWQSLAELIHRRADNLPDRSQAAPLYLQASQIFFERLRDSARAKQALTPILELIPNHPQALLLWRDVALSEGDYTTAVKILRQEIQGSQNDQEKSSLFLEIARIFEEHMDNTEHAAVAYHQGFLLDQDNLNAMEQALRLYRVREEWQRVISLMRSRLENVQDDSSRAELMFQIGQIFLQHLEEGQTEEGQQKATQLFQQALQLNPNLGLFEDALERYKEQNQWGQVLALLRAKLEVSEPTEQVSLYLQLGNVLLQHAEEGQTPEGQKKASAYFEQALALDPDCQEAKDAMEELSFALEDWTSLLKKLKKEIRQASKEPERAAFLNYKIAEGYYTRENKAAYAVRYCKQALDLHPQHGKSLELLQRLYAELGRWEALAEFLVEQSEKAEDDTNRVKWLKKLARLYRDQTQEPEREVETLERILEINSSERDTLQL
ncbi:MAG: hypothetical protein AAGJ35_10260, partial [Myxococcota bacterium]